MGRENRLAWKLIFIVSAIMIGLGRANVPDETGEPAAFERPPSIRSASAEATPGSVPNPNPGLSQSSSVIQTKLDGKQHRLDNGGKKKPQHPDGLILERVRQRAGNDGKIPMDALIRAKERVDGMRTANRDAAIWTWEWLGPGNVGGRVRSILTDPSNANNILIGSVSGGIWRSTNGGASWAPVDDFMANLAVTSLERDPNNQDVVYAATGEGFNNTDALPGAGIFRSDNGGTSWYSLSATNNDDFRWVNRLAVDPNISDIVYAAVVESDFDGKIYKTTDGGATWNSVRTTFGRAFDVKTHPTLSGVVLAGSDGGVYLSVDSGSTWTEETGGGTQMPSSSNTNGRCEVAFASNTTHMYVSMERTGGEIWRTTNGGSSWTQRSSGKNYLGGQGWFNNTIWVDPASPDWLIVGGIDLHRSTDGGLDIVQISDWRDYHDPGNSAHADQHAIVPDTNYLSNKVVYVANDGGIQRAVDPWTMGQNSWENLANGLGITQFYSGAAASDGSVIVGGTQDNDHLRYRSTDGIDGWYQAQTGDGGDSEVDFTDPSIIYSEYTQLQIEKSIDGGETYVTSTSGLSDAGTNNALFIAPFAMDPNDETSLVGGGTSIWQTTDAAGSWSAIRGPLTGTQLCTAIEISKPSSHYWIGYTSGRVSKSTDGGSSWTDVDGNGVGLPNRWITDIAVSPTNDDDVFVVLAGYEIDNVWYSSNGGSSWTNRSGTPPYDLPALQVNTVTFHPVNTNWVYIGTDLGIFASESRGTIWSATPAYGGHEGPSNVEVDDLFFYGDQWLVAATHGRGMYRSRPFTTVYVNRNAPPGGDGSESNPYQTVAEAESVRGPATDLSIAAGNYSEGPITLTKAGSISPTGGNVTIQ